MRNILFIGLMFLGFLAEAQEKNLALGRPVSANSGLAAYPASNITDGKINRNSRWQASQSRPPHIVELDLGKYCQINEIRIHSGIREEEKQADEKSQAAGFWSIKNFKLQYWDDANWSDLPASEIHENRLVTIAFKYNPSITTFRLRLVCDDGEPISIMEWEVLGTVAANMPAPPAFTQTSTAASGNKKDRTANVKVSDEQVGKSMKYVGYNQGYYMPGSNTSSWIEYSGVNGLRVWASLNSFIPETSVQRDAGLTTLEEFDARKARLRNAPEANEFLQWSQFLPLYDQPDSSSTNAMVYNYALEELKKLKVDVILQISSTDFEDNWSNKWKQWQRYYALAFYSAKKGDVSRFALMNEPNHRNAGPMKLDQWIMAMEIVSDAVHCAVQDVNRLYSKDLKPAFVGPVTAGYNPEWWSAVAKNIRTGYDGKTLNEDLLQIFSTHSYNSPAAGYETRIQNIQDIIRQNHPAHDTLPIVYTEIGRWMNAYLIDREETMDDPSLFTEWAGIYTNNMLNGGYGMFAFKFANTASSQYPRGIKSGHHFVWQGRRIVEDKMKNLALNARVIAPGNASLITDGKKEQAWVSDAGTVTVELGVSKIIGGAIIYSGRSGAYTAPDRIKNFKLEYRDGNNWIPVPGGSFTDNKYAQLYIDFKRNINTSALRMVIEDKGEVKLREIKLLSPQDIEAEPLSYDVAGIQRTGEVVRLFAKGFKEERPLLKTVKSVEDHDLDCVTSFDPISGNYYMWLVQRGGFTYHLNIDLGKMAAGKVVTAETVDHKLYGEARPVIMRGSGLSIDLAPQSVTLVTVHATASAAHLVAPSGAVCITPATRSKMLKVHMDASKPATNQVSFISFPTASVKGTTLLKVRGLTNKSTPYRFHVYAIPSWSWNASTLTWASAPLAKDESLLRTPYYVAGELAFLNKDGDHYLDVTDILSNHPAGSYTFVFIRETREIGDDADDNFAATITQPQLIYYDNIQKK